MLGAAWVWAAAAAAGAWRAWALLLGGARLLLPAAALLLRASRRGPAPARAPGAPRAVARRAARLDVPGLTLPALRHCVERKCKDIEFDVRITKDGQCVLYHESTVGGKELINTEWTDLKDIPIEEDHPMSAKFGVSNLCLFSDAIEYLVANQIKCIINVNVMDKRIFTTIVETFKKHPELYDTAIVSSFNPIIIYRLRIMNAAIAGALNYQPKYFSMISYNPFTSRKRFPENIFYQMGVRILDELYYMLWSTKILAYWTGCSAVILHKDIASLSMIDSWRDSKYSVYLWGVNQPLDKLYAAKILRVPYITDTLTGEPCTIGEMNGKSH